MQDDVLLFIGGGRETVSALGKAKALGYKVCVTDGDENSVGIRWAKKYATKWAIASTYDCERTAEVVRGWDVKGVVAVACDVGPTVSYVARQNGLNCIPYELAVLSWNKNRLKAFLNKGGKGIPMPQPYNIYSPKYCVVKPVDGRGSRGVFRVKGPKLDNYIVEAQKVSKVKEVVVEEWIDGPQVSTETIVWNGVCVFTGMTDRFYHFLDDMAPYVIENGGIGPSIYEGSPTGDAIKDLVKWTVSMLGFESGTIKCDVVLNREKDFEPTLIECAIGRMSGGLTCSHYLPLAYGFDFLAAAFDIACGRPPYRYNLVHKNRHICGSYALDIGKAKIMKDRGKFFMAMASTREEALNKSWEISSKRLGYNMERTIWLEKITKQSDPRQI